MLYKETVCPECGGHGFTTEVSAYSVCSTPCTHCTEGKLLVPVTNGDLIRRCTNEQLARVHMNLRTWALYSGGNHSRILKNSQEDFLLWLNKETDASDLRSIFDFIDEQLDEPVL